MRRLRRIGLPYLLLVPALVLELLVHIVPMLIGIAVAFFKLTVLYMRHWQAAPFAGLANFRVSLDLNNAVGRSLLSSFGLTVGFTVLSVGVAWLLGFAMAVLLQGRVRGRRIWRTLFLVPYAVPIYAGVITWTFMLQRDNGLVNHLLINDLHLVDDNPFWLIGDNSFVSLVVVQVWRIWPFAFLMLMAGMQAIPTELFEVAALDGASVGQQVRNIVLPLLQPISRVLLLVLFLWTFNEFNAAYILFGGSPPPQGDILSVHVYQSAFQNYNFGLGSAQSVLLLVFLFVVTMIYLALVLRRRHHAV